MSNTKETKTMQSMNPVSPEAELLATSIEALISAMDAGNGYFYPRKFSEMLVKLRKNNTKTEFITNEDGENEEVETVIDEELEKIFTLLEQAHDLDISDAKSTLDNSLKPRKNTLNQIHTLTKTYSRVDFGEKDRY